VLRMTLPIDQAPNATTSLKKGRVGQCVWSARSQARDISLGFCSAALSYSSVIDRSFVTPNAFGIYLPRICNSVRLEMVPVSF